VITAEEERYILKRRVPEHVAGLMAPLSKGEPFLMEDYPGYAGDDWHIVEVCHLRGGVPFLEYEHCIYETG